MKIYLPLAVRGTWPIGHPLKAEAGRHFAVEDEYGNVAVVLEDGHLLHVNAGEFERCDGAGRTVKVPLTGTVS